MNASEILGNHLKDTSDISYYEVIFLLIKDRITTMDNSVPKLLNKAFNHRYTISRIEKAKKEGKEGLFGKEPDYDAQLEDQYRLIKGIQQKMHEMKSEFSQLNKALETIELLKNYHLEIISETGVSDINISKRTSTIGSLKYLFNSEYEQKLIESYQTGLEKEGLDPWEIKSMDEIKA